MPRPAARVLVGIGVLLVLLGSLAVAALARRAAPEPPAVVVLAASSLTEALQAAGAGWTAQGNPPVTFSFEASSRLAKQVEAGVPADLFVSADLAWMEYLDARRLLDRTTRVNLVGNTLVAVVPAGAPRVVASPADLVRPEVRHLALGGENVPVGTYARAGLAALGVWEAVQDRVVNGDNARTVLGWVATGEAEAGVVYATDARVEPRVAVAFPFPASSHPPIVYPAAVLAGAPHAREAARFLAWCQGDQGRASFTNAGFSTPQP